MLKYFVCILLFIVHIDVFVHVIHLSFSNHCCVCCLGIVVVDSRDVSKVDQKSVRWINNHVSQCNKYMQRFVLSRFPHMFKQTQHPSNKHFMGNNHPSICMQQTI